MSKAKSGGFSRTVLSFSMTMPWYSASIHGLCLLADPPRERRGRTCELARHSHTTLIDSEKLTLQYHYPFHTLQKHLQVEKMRTRNQLLKESEGLREVTAFFYGRIERFHGNSLP